TMFVSAPLSVQLSPLATRWPHLEESPPSLISAGQRRKRILYASGKASAVIRISSGLSIDATAIWANGLVNDQKRDRGCSGRSCGAARVERGKPIQNSRLHECRAIARNLWGQYLQSPG